MKKLTEILFLIFVLLFFKNLYAGDIYTRLANNNLFYENFPKTIENKSCTFTLQLLDQSDKPIISFISTKNINENTVTAWWEIEKLSKTFKESSFEKRTTLTGHELNKLVEDYPMLQHNWFYSFNNTKNLKAKLVSFTSFPLTINGEVHVFLKFKVESADTSLSAGILSNIKLPSFSD